MKAETQQRTLKQNNALHMMFETGSQELNNGGMYISNIIRADAPWNAERFKELIWRPTQKLMTGKTSTTQLSTKEVDEISDVICRALGEKGIELRFPHIEAVMDDMAEKEPAFVEKARQWAKNKGR